MTWYVCVCLFGQWPKIGINKAPFIAVYAVETSSKSFSSVIIVNVVGLQVGCYPRLLIIQRLDYTEEHLLDNTNYETL